MNSDDWNRWLTLGANLGVFVGLILVAYEINQSGTQLELAASGDGTDNFTHWSIKREALVKGILMD